MLQLPGRPIDGTADCRLHVQIGDFLNAAFNLSRKHIEESGTMHAFPERVTAHSRRLAMTDCVRHMTQRCCRAIHAAPTCTAVTSRVAVCAPAVGLHGSSRVLQGEGAGRHAAGVRGTLARPQGAVAVAAQASGPRLRGYTPGERLLRPRRSRASSWCPDATRSLQHSATMKKKMCNAATTTLHRGVLMPFEASSRV